MRTVNIHEAKTQLSRLVEVPDDFDRMGAAEIERLFAGAG